MNTKLKFFEKVPSVKNQDSAILIYDKFLVRIPAVKKWIETFPQRHAVASGENLKNIEQLPTHLNQLIKFSASSHKVYVLGGGSVGDFGGFIASIFKRGLPVVQIPTTWLSALDSAHGGKTALNVSGFKNQIGTFHFPEEVWIIKSLLEAQPPVRLFEASGEFMKTAMIGGESYLKKLQKWNWKSGKIVWADLKSFIAIKYKIAKLDPFEKKGIRYQLNLGHTIGHVWEAHFGIPHGIAIFHGLLFDIAWSVQLKMLNPLRSFQLMDEMPWSYVWDQEFEKKTDLKIYGLSEAKLRSYLTKDKKNKNGMINFTFIEKPGKIIIKKVSIEDVLREYRRQQRTLQELYEVL